MMESPAHKAKKRRADSAFGMHFDFHAHHDQENIGATADPEQIDRLLKRVKPDFVQCDTKGHFGYSSYPTKVGVQAPKLAGDLLRMWRTVTANNNVALYAHHSTLWDDATAIEHPEWAIVDENDVVSRKYLSIFSPYIRERFIPQMIEIATEYGVDGTWIDGDSWCMQADYSNWARDAYRSKTGKDLPHKDDADFPNYLAFLRQEFRAYVSGYCEAIHAAAPQFQICSNSLMGPKYNYFDVPTMDFLSADVMMMGNFRLYTRCFMQHNIPWDVMSWAFAHEVFDITASAGFYYTTKELPQICQEAALVMSMGGAYQFVNFPTVDHTYEWAISRWEQLAAFCRAREPYCFQAKPISQAGVLYSLCASQQAATVQTAASGSLFPDTTSLVLDTIAVLDILLDNQYSTEMLYGERIESDQNLGTFGLIALPDMAVIEEGVKERLLAYAREGGTLLLTGPQTLSLFAGELGITTGPVEDAAILYVACDDAAVAIISPYCEPTGDFAVTGRFYRNNFMEGPAGIASILCPYGKGRIAALTFDLTEYAQKPTACMRRFVAQVVKNAWQAPKVSVTGSEYVEVALMEKDGLCCLNLTNILGGARITNERVKVMTFDELPPLHDLSIEINWPAKPKAVMIEPEHQPAAFRYEDGVIRLKLDTLAVHTVITVE